MPRRRPLVVLSFLVAAVSGAAFVTLRRHPPAPIDARSEARAGRTSEPLAVGPLRDGCITADEALLVVGGGGHAVIDVARGAVVAQGEDEVVGVSCEGSRAVVLGTDATLGFPGGARGPAIERGGDRLVASFDDGTRVWTSRASRDGRPEGPLTIVAESSASRRTHVLVPELFGDVGRARAEAVPDRFAMWAGGSVPGRRLLVAASWLSEPGAAARAPWGLFAVELESGRVTPMGASVPGSPTGDFARAPSLAAIASPDGGLFAAGLSDGASSTLVLVRPASGAAPVRVAIAGAEGIARIAFTPDARRVAVATTEAGGHSRVLAYDTTDGRALSHVDVDGAVVALGLLHDGSVVYATDARQVVRIAIADGRTIYRLDLANRP